MYIQTFHRATGYGALLSNYRDHPPLLLVGDCWEHHHLHHHYYHRLIPESGGI